LLFYSAVGVSCNLKRIKELNRITGITIPINANFLEDSEREDPAIGSAPGHL
jgi:hypothetical protein